MVERRAVRRRFKSLRERLSSKMFGLGIQQERPIGSSEDSL